MSRNDKVHEYIQKNMREIFYLAHGKIQQNLLRTTGNGRRANFAVNALDQHTLCTWATATASSIHLHYQKCQLEKKIQTKTWRNTTPLSNNKYNQSYILEKRCKLEHEKKKKTAPAVKSDTADANCFKSNIFFKKISKPGLRGRQPSHQRFARLRGRNTQVSWRPALLTRRTGRPSCGQACLSVRHGNIRTNNQVKKNWYGARQIIVNITCVTKKRCATKRRGSN